MTRRELLLRAGGGFGALACDAMLRAAAQDPLAPRPSHFPAKAKNVIYLFMHGGVSQVDTFDYKPELSKRSGQTLSLEIAKTIETTFIHDPTKALLLGSPWEFRPGGESGVMVSDLLPNIRGQIDDIAVIRSCRSNVFDHAPAIYLMNSGSQFPGRPSLGSWVTYGLGSENQNLPAFVVMSDGSTKSGPQAYSAGFLPAVYEGTVFRSGESPILHLKTPQGIKPETQRETLGFINKLDRLHQQSRQDSTLEARIAAYELAYRMQSEAPDAVDIANESEATKKLYGIGDGLSDDFGRKCLLARRLVQKGVRFVQLYAGTQVGDDWDDAHTDLVGSHNKMAGKVDKPVSGLLKDLKALGMLEETLIVWSSEFGRTPLAQGKNGRDHHPYGFTTWMAGAGIKGGKVLGATDEFGVNAVENPITAHDINATILRLIGMDHTKLTYFYQGRDQRLTDVEGENEFTDWLLG